MTFYIIYVLWTWKSSVRLVASGTFPSVNLQRVENIMLFKKKCFEVDEVHAFLLVDQCLRKWCADEIEGGYFTYKKVDVHRHHSRGQENLSVSGLLEIEDIILRFDFPYIVYMHEGTVRFRHVHMNMPDGFPRGYRAEITMHRMDQACDWHVSIDHLDDTCLMLEALNSHIRRTRQGTAA